MFNALEDRVREVIIDVLESAYILRSNETTTEALAEYIIDEWINNTNTKKMILWRKFYHDDIREVTEEYELAEENELYTFKTFRKVLIQQAFDLLEICPSVESQRVLRFGKIIYSNDLAKKICEEITEV